MLTRKKNNSKPAKEKAIVLQLNSSYKGLEYLVDIVKKIRPENANNTNEAELKFQALLFQLQDKSNLFSLRRALLSQFTKSNIIPALTESGIISSRGFVQELISKVKHKFLPAYQRPNNFLYVISHVFYKRSDHIWVKKINNNLWKQFFLLLGIEINITQPAIIRQLKEALQILSYRITTLGLEKEVTQRYDDFNDSVHPFLEQNKLINLYIEKGESITTHEKHVIFSNVKENLYNCRQSIRWIHNQRMQHGTSLAQTFVTVRLEQQLQRIQIILDVLDADGEFDTERFIDYFYTVITNENTKNSLQEFLSQNLGLLAYQIAEHKGKKGEQYISSTRKDFWQLFKSALKGGFIVSFVAIIKNLLGLLHLPIFWQGFAYGTNYAAGFVIMDQTGSTLATKQPAYTASAVAGSLDVQKQNGKPDLRNLALTVAKVSRSQIASFAGNLFIVFPLTYLLAWVINESAGFKLASGDAALKLMQDQHPYKSLALLYACFTGFFLFLSGIIAGYIENHIIYAQVTERLKSHPVFSTTMSLQRREKLAAFVNKNAGALAGSICLGFFLGFAGPVGKSLGIPFDIRHITISAGNTAIGYFGVNHNVPLIYFLTIIGGVLSIGFINFLVSFSLAFYVAVKSRGIRLRDYPEFLGILRRYFAKHPKDFLLPSKQQRLVDELA
jgi:site-specific recombinase